MDRFLSESIFYCFFFVEKKKEIVKTYEKEERRIRNTPKAKEKIKTEKTN